MAIEVVPITTGLFGRINEPSDCMVLKLDGTFDGSSGVIEIAFPFHEDTPNFRLNLREAMELRNAIDRLYGIKLIENRGGNY